MTSDFITEYPHIYLLSCIFFWYSCHLIYRLILNYQPKNKWIILGIWVFGSGATTSLILINSSVNSIYTAVISIVQCVLVTQFYEGSFQKKIVSSLFAWSITSVFEALTFYFSAFAFQMSIDTYNEKPVYAIIAHTISKLVPLFIFSLYPYFFKTSFNKQNMLSPMQAIAFFFIPIVSVFSIIYLHIQYMSATPSLESTIVMVCVSFLLVNAIFFWIFEAFSSSMKQHYEHKMLEMQVNYYEELYSKVGEERTALSTLRHNMKNDLLSLKSSLKSKDIEKLEMELNCLLEDTSLENHRTSVIPIVDAVLSYKIQQAEKLGVTILHEQAINCNLQISNPHLANIIGNALDNAVEHCSQMEDKQKRSVRLFLKKLDKNLLLTVSNYYEGNIQFQNELPLSSKRDGKSHGIGLATIRSVVKELGGHFSIETDNQVFTVKVVIYQCFP